MLTVLKPFPHPIRRFTIGQEITEAELAGCVISLADLKKGRFVAGAETKAAEAAVERAESVDVPPAEPFGDRDLGRKAKT